MSDFALCSNTNTAMSHCPPPPFCLPHLAYTPPCGQFHTAASEKTAPPLPSGFYIFCCVIPRLSSKQKSAPKDPLTLRGSQTPCLLYLICGNLMNLESNE